MGDRLVLFVVEISQKVSYALLKCAWRAYRDSRPHRNLIARV
jgi:hypothetical protein